MAPYGLRGERIGEASHPGPLGERQGAWHDDDDEVQSLTDLDDDDDDDVQPLADFTDVQLLADVPQGVAEGQPLVDVPPVVADTFTGTDFHLLAASGAPVPASARAEQAHRDHVACCPTTCHFFVDLRGLQITLPSDALHLFVPVAGDMPWQTALARQAEQVLSAQDHDFLLHILATTPATFNGDHLADHALCQHLHGALFGSDSAACWVVLLASVQVD